MPAIEKMISTPAPVVLDVCVDKDECVFPMVPAGGANKDMILTPPTREVKDRAAKSQTGDGKPNGQLQGDFLLAYARSDLSPSQARGLAVD